MAVLLHSAAMPPNQQKSLHPFFDRSTNQIIPRNPHASQDPTSLTLNHGKPPVDSQDKAIHRPESAFNLANPGGSGNDNSGSADTRIEKDKYSEIDVERAHRLEEDKPEAITSATNQAHPDVPPDESSNTAILNLNRASPSTADDGSRKRRKLTPSDSKALPADPASLSSPVASRASHEDEKGRTSGKPDIDTTDTAAPEPIEQEPVKPAPTDPTHNDNSAMSSPPKKVLRLNGTGGFGSPPSKRKSDNQHESNTAYPGRPKRSSRKPKSCMLILRYGGDDPERRKFTGQKIDMIQSELRANSSVADNQPAPVSGMNSAKSTHPFFLGKSMREALQPTASIDLTDDSNADNATNAAKPHKIFSTSGRIWTTKMKNTSDQSVSANSVALFPKSWTFRLPGTYEAPWPGTKFTRIDDLNAQGAVSLPPRPGRHSFLQIKRKTKPPIVEPHENILTSFQRSLLDKAETSKGVLSEKGFQCPQRIINSGRGIQEMVLTRFGLPSGQAGNLGHPMLEKIFEQISTSLSAFDKGECESLAWTQKYAPQSTVDVLQSQREMTVLKTWLLTQTVTSTSHHLAAKKRPEESVKRQKRKKRKIDSEMDDFIVGSDDDENLVSIKDLSDHESASPGPTNLVRSLIREDMELSGKSKANAIMISGPHGCGKTAAALAAAKELDFDVFEIGPGSQRSGKDILDKVGDMTLNHQVSKAGNPAEPTPDIAEDTLPETAAADQSTLASFFSTKGPKAKKEPKAKTPIPLASSLQKPKQTPRQKQAVILLEEIDVLFEQDKQFWETVVELAVQSRRPIIMTCSDETLAPLEDLSLYAILRFRPPQEALAAKYLLLLAAIEGHILDLEATTNLYRSRKHDLRASITELQYWCQMAIGDRKGGIEWFLPRWPPGIDIDEHNRKLRVASENTLPRNIILPEHYVGANFGTFTGNDDLLHDAWAEWALEPSELTMQCLDETLFLDDRLYSSTADRISHLQEIGRCLDLLSANDVHSSVDLPSRPQMDERLDATQPPVSEAQRSNYITGYHLIQADTLKDYHQFDSQASIYTSLSICNRAFNEIPHPDDSAVAWRTNFNATLYPRIATNLLKRSSVGHFNLQTCQEANSKEMLAAFMPLVSLPTPHPLITSFERGSNIINTDLAPYIRSICAYDLALERQRGILTSSQGSASEKVKQTRTTRASRSALEGSQRSVTRRERWFAKDLDLDLVLGTAGAGWPLLQISQHLDEDEVAPGQVEEQAVTRNDIG